MCKSGAIGFCFVARLRVHLGHFSRANHGTALEWHLAGQELRAELRLSGPPGARRLAVSSTPPMRARPVADAAQLVQGYSKNPMVFATGAKVEKDQMPPK